MDLTDLFSVGIIAVLVIIIAIIELGFFAWILGIVLKYFGYIIPFWIRFIIVFLAQAFLKFSININTEVQKL